MGFARGIAIIVIVVVGVEEADVGRRCKRE